MNETIRKLKEQFESRNTRERILLTLAVVTVIGVLWLNLYSDPLTSNIVRMEKEKAQLSADVNKLDSQLQALQKSKENDPGTILQGRIAIVENDIKVLDDDLNKQLHGFIAPEQMTYVLDSIFEHHTNLTLTRVKSLPAVSITNEITEFANSERDNTPSNNSQTVTANTKNKSIEIYRHGLQIEFEGTYMATLAFLHELESLSWAFYWDEILYEVDKYPKAKVVIRIHTLSLEQGWIGV